jgi:molybdopterin molybdotransferase
MPRALAMQRGEQVLPAGRRISAIDIGLLHEVGRDRGAVFPPPSVAVLATGNELVDAPAAPQPGQIRNSNGPMLMALVERAGGQAVSLGNGRDERDDLLQRIGAGLRQDVLVLSGGVSAGVLDLVPVALRELGVRQVFHKVNLKPGKPLWFGEFTRSDGWPTLVFGLPGNPVSSLVCFELFVRPAIDKLSGAAGAGLPEWDAALENEHTQRGDRPTFYPGRLRFAAGRVHVRTLAWQGSADLKTLSMANALVCFPAGQAEYKTGDIVRTLRLAESFE